MSAFEQSCMVVVMTSLIVLVVASAAFLAL
jgi:hypothetical protein